MEWEFIQQGAHSSPQNKAPQKSRHLCIDLGTWTVQHTHGHIIRQQQERHTHSLTHHSHWKIERSPIFRHKTRKHVNGTLPSLERKKMREMSTTYHTIQKPESTASTSEKEQQKQLQTCRTSCTGMISPAASAFSVELTASGSSWRFTSGFGGDEGSAAPQ